MVNTFFILLVNALFFLGIVAAVGGFFLILVELFRDGEHFFKHHPTRDCSTC